MLESVPDPRDRRGVRYPLAGVLALAVTAVVAGCRSFAAIGQWAAEAAAEHLAAFGLTRAGAPDESTLRKLFARIDADALDGAVGRWMWTLTRIVDGRRVIALDGKTVRGARTRPDGKAPHLIAAFDHASGAVLGQVAVDAKSNEIPAARTLLAGLELTGVTVTMDAMHTQTDTATLITEAGGDYVFTVKGNMCATRRSDVYPPQAGRLEGRFLGLMTYLEPKGEGDRACQETSGRVRMPGTARWEDPHGMAKAGLLEPQSPAAAIYCGRNGICNRCPSWPGRMVRPGQPSRRKRCPVRALKEMSGAPEPC